MKKEIRNLAVDLDHEELHHRALRLAEISGEVERIEAEVSSFKKKKYREVKGLREEMAALTDVVNKGREIREVECRVVPDWDNKVLKIIRNDKDELVDSIPITEDHAQMDFVDDEVVPLRQPASSKRSPKLEKGGN